MQISLLHALFTLHFSFSHRSLGSKASSSLETGLRADGEGNGRYGFSISLFLLDVVCFFCTDWRAIETARVKENPQLSEEEKHNLLQQLLSKETSLLQLVVDRRKIAAAKENRESRINSKLSDMSSAKTWPAVAGKEQVYVVTPFTQRAEELSNLFQNLSMPCCDLFFDASL